MSPMRTAARVVLAAVAASTAARAAPPAPLLKPAPAPPITPGGGTPVAGDFNGDRASDLLVPTRGGLVVLRP